MKNKKLTWKELKHLCRGIITVQKLLTHNLRTHTFTTKYAPKIRGKLLRTKSGLKFSTYEGALKAGRRCIKNMRKDIKLIDSI